MQSPSKVLWALLTTTCQDTSHLPCGHFVTCGSQSDTPLTCSTPTGPSKIPVQVRPPEEHSDPCPHPLVPLVVPTPHVLA